VALSGAASAQIPRLGAQEQTVETPDRVDARSPRIAISEFLRAARRGQFDVAATYLDLGTRFSADSGPVLARRLKAVLDQHLIIDLESVSPLAAGDTLDGLTPPTEQIGTVRNDIGVREPIQLARRPNGAEPAWVFSAATVRRINDWYAALPDHWMRDRMPSVLQQPGPYGIERWQWLMLLLLVPPAIAVGWLFGRLTIFALRRVVRRTQTAIDDRIVERANGPMNAMWGVVSYRVLVEFIGLSLFATAAVGTVARAFVAVLAVWWLVRLTYVFEAEIPASHWSQERPEMRSLLPLIGRVSRIFLVAIGIILFVAQFGYKVTTLIATLGIGGIAVALAAQKTLEHMFGSVAIGVDQPIRVGDWVRVADHEGEVEMIGLRSTRLRTIERTLVVIPNGRLADMHMENFGVRDRVLLRTQLSLRYGTSVAQLKQVREEIDRYLRDHPLVWPERVIVAFRGFTPGLELEVIAWIATTDYNIFREARQEIFFRFLEIIEGAGTDFAAAAQILRISNRDGLNG
jgi:MscS family membrane protein